jgi:hypothetical protein
MSSACAASGGGRHWPLTAGSCHGRQVTSPLCQRPIIAYTRAACNQRGGTLQASQTVDGAGRRHDARLDRTRPVPRGGSPKPLNPWQSVLSRLGKVLGRPGEQEPRHGSRTTGGLSGWQSGGGTADGDLGARPLLSHSAELRKAALEAAGCRPLLCHSQGQLGASPATEQGADAARVDMLSLLYELSCLGIRSLMVEGGAQVASHSPPASCLSPLAFLSPPGGGCARFPPLSGQGPWPWHDRSSEASCLAACPTTSSSRSPPSCWVVRYGTRRHKLPASSLPSACSARV